MTRFVVGDDRSQSTLFPERLEDYLAGVNWFSCHQVGVQCAVILIGNVGEVIVGKRRIEVLPLAIHA